MSNIQLEEWICPLGMSGIAHHKDAKPILNVCPQTALFHKMPGKTRLPFQRVTENLPQFYFVECHPIKIQEELISMH